VTAELTRDGCTAWAVHPENSPDGHLRIGQNWDWNRDVLGAVLHDHVDDDFTVLGFTEAGIFGCKIGLNSAGLGLCINGLYSSDDSWETICTPMHVRFHNILQQRQINDAIDVVLGENRSIAGNFLLGQAPNCVVNIEAGTTQHNRLDWHAGFIVHANHFVGEGVAEPQFERRHTSVGRHERMAELLQSAGSVGHDDLIAFSRDRINAPDAVCRIGDDPTRPYEDQGVTITGVILDLTTREAFFTDGPPNQANYVRYGL
jgi:isopenicillin-N N-acyltransferase-like protein